MLESYHAFGTLIYSSWTLVCFFRTFSLSLYVDRDMPERSTGPMMFIGERCALDECHREDFLPFKCSDCRLHFCSNHFRPQTHRCSSYHQGVGDYRVPLCPVCDTPPEGWKRDQDPNIVMNRHLSGQCSMLDANGHVKPAGASSASTAMKRAKKTNECTFVKCSKIMIVPIQVCI